MTKSSYKELEEKFAEFVGTKYAVAVNSGTAALHLSMAALDIGPGDEVIVPDFCMAAAAFAVSYTGAKPVFVDCGDDLLIDVSKVREKINSRTRAIIAVDIYGRVCDMQVLDDIANEHALTIIEDACEVHGAKVGPADAICFSFYRNKIVNGEEGGIICTNDEQYYKDMQDMKSMSFGETHDYFHKRIGFNYRMPDSQATLILQSLASINENLAKRKQVEVWYDKYVPDQCKMPEREVVWVYDILHHNKDEIIKNVPGARHFFKPMTSMPMYRARKSANPKAYNYSSFGLYLPVNPSMTETDVQNVVKYVII